MTNQNNAAHDLGTSSGGRAYIADYFATQLRRHDFKRYINDSLAADFACVLAQHLSKLRAEGVQSADERLATALRTIAEYPNPGEGSMSAANMREIARAALNGFPVSGKCPPSPPAPPSLPYREVESGVIKQRARAALASAPVDDAGNWQQYRLRGSNETAEQIIERERMAYADLLQSVMDKRRERASAPVAGEAQPFMYGIMGPDGKAHFEEFCVSGDRDELQAEVVDHLNRDNPEDRPFSVVALFRDAAPKASAEDVRNAALEEAARMMEQTGKRIAASDIRALKQPQGKPPAPSQATDKEQA
ncbi:hypothetical protein LMG26846_01971 [Achromobacter insuavis]|uniref:hypothetical protein n=1 Tax=Achromobacter insuavis TaxID=1287735 RepID=UPI00146955DB|nr:hypothetical protein [Achromobacter insuavis]CAB3850558.1 hypothetical protein LMG26846_01971 [Achromobacter insuavis]